VPAAVRFIVKWRWAIVAFWLVIMVAGGIASLRLNALLVNRFDTPGTESDHARAVLAERFGDQADGQYLVIFHAPGRLALGERRRLFAATHAAAAGVPSGRAGQLRELGHGVFYATITSTLSLSRAKAATPRLLAILKRRSPIPVFLSGQAAIQHDLDPIFQHDLRRGELEIAIPAALLVLLAVLGISPITVLPLFFAGASIAGTLGLVFIAAHFFSIATYVTNLVELIGLALAVDYSLLVVYRFREELEREEDESIALARTLRSAGRAVLFSGLTVAIGLGLLLFIPVPLVRSLGFGGFLIPLVSLAASVTLLPALLSIFGRRGAARLPAIRLRVLPRNVAARITWRRLAFSIMRRPRTYLACAAVALLAIAAPALLLRLTPGSAQGVPRSPQAIQGFDLLSRRLGPGALWPTQIVIESARTAPVGAATARLIAQLRVDPEVEQTSPPLTDARGTAQELVVVGRHEYGDAAAQSFVRRLRRTIIPVSDFPDNARVLVGGGPAQGVDFLQRSYQFFPWLVLAVLLLTYVLLLRAFRSIILPLKAVALNVLSVSASYGVLVVFFRFGVGHDLFGLYRFGQIEGWIPIFLFAILFGLSMDYEVFLVSRMREAWDAGASNSEAVAEGLERTGRIVTAAALIMVAAFSGFVTGHIAGLQEFGIGLAAAILFDATVIRCLLVPALMATIGRYNWWLPANVARIVRVQPSAALPQEAVVPARDHLRLDLAHRIERDAGDDQNRRTA
jgi:RND superfamily putative drug exporter